MIPFIPLESYVSPLPCQIRIGGGGDRGGGGGGGGC